MRRLLVGVAGMLLAGGAMASGAERGTPAEAQTMLRKAVAHYRAVGRTQALADFNKKVAPFGDRDLYVMCLAADGTIVANGGFPEYVGQSADQLRDADGKPLGKALWEAGTKGQGSVSYKWLNPITQNAEHKVSFVQKAGDDVCSVGAYAHMRIRRAPPSNAG